MENTHKFNNIGTPMIPIPQHNQTKRLPPKIVPLRYKLNITKVIVPSKTKMHQDTYEINDTFAELGEKSPKLPVISIKKHSLNASSTKFNKYSKCLPKFPIYRPLFHDRNKSYGKVPDEDEEYTAMKNKISWMDY